MYTAAQVDAYKACARVVRQAVLGMLQGLQDATTYQKLKEARDSMDYQWRRGKLSAALDIAEELNVIGEAAKASDDPRWHRLAKLLSEVRWLERHVGFTNHEKVAECVANIRVLLPTITDDLLLP